LTLAAVGALLMMPAAALASSGSGTVLSINGAHRTIEVVDSGHVVHAYGYHGSLPKVHAGSRICPSCPCRPRGPPRGSRRLQVGDLVDVTYTDNGDGTYDASDVGYVEQDATGTVTAVSDGSMTFTDSDSGQSVTVTADPAAGVFDGVAVGDEVDVNYHQSGDQLVADEVDDGS
jgi:hypothetical protein